MTLGLRRRITFVIHAFSDSHMFHFISYSPLILHLINLGLLLLDVFLPLLLIDLLLECLLHCNLFSLSLILYDMFLIPTMHENIAISLQIEINSVFQHPSSGLDIWKILLSDASIEITIVSCFILDVKCLIIGVECLLLIFLDVYSVLLSLCFLPFFLFTKEVSFLYLSLQFFCKVFLLKLFFNEFIFIIGWF